MRAIIKCAVLSIAISGAYAALDGATYLDIESPKEPSSAITQCSPDDYPCQAAQLRAFSEQVPIAGTSFTDTWLLMPEESSMSDTNSDEKPHSSPVRVKREIPSEDFILEEFAGSTERPNEHIKQIPELNGVSHNYFTAKNINTNHPSLLELYDTESIVKRKVYNGLKPTFQMHLKDPQTGEIRGSSNQGYEDAPIKHHGDFTDSEPGITTFQLYIDDGEYGKNLQENKNSAPKKTDFLSRVWKSDETSINEKDLPHHSASSEQTDTNPILPENEYQSETASNEGEDEHTSSENNTQDFAETPGNNTNLEKATFKEKLSNFSSHLIKMHPVKVEVAASNETHTKVPVTTSSSSSSSVSIDKETSLSASPNVFNRVRSKLNINAVYANSTAYPTHHTNHTSAHSSGPKNTQKYANGTGRLSPSIGWTIIAAFSVAISLLLG